MKDQRLLELAVRKHLLGFEDPRIVGPCEQPILNKSVILSNGY